MEDQVKDFYSKLKFPGTYSLSDLEFYDSVVHNPYLQIFDSAVTGTKSVLDIGCGSGFITNFLARRHPEVQFDAVDFSDSIDYAKKFTETANISNIHYYKENFLDWVTDKKYDLVICNGVLHHIPEHEIALEKLKDLTNNKLVLGIYNTYGKLLKKLVPVKYINDVLYIDQEKCPFEVSFTDAEFRSKLKDFQMLKTHPGYKNHFVNFYNLFNSSNGGLTVYVFSRVTPKQNRYIP
jgi:SAM-dependent methyltransferase